MKRIINIFFVIVLLMTLVSCNKERKIEENTDINKTTLEDIAAFNIVDIESAEMMNLIVDYLNTSFEIPEYYFPKDENGLFMLEKKDGVFNFSDYFLYGDMNNDGVVDEEDVHIMDRAIKESDYNYDINGDEKINGKDMTIILESLLLEVDSFSFYDENKKPIDINDVAFNDSRIISIESYDKIYVAVNDSNGNNQLNNSQGTISLLERLDFFVPKVYASEYDYEIKEKLEKFFSHMDRTPDKYLLAWTCNVKSIKNTSSKNATIENIGLLTPYHQLLTDTFKEKVVNVHFNPYNMLSEIKIVEDDYRWVAYAGMNTSNAMREKNEITVEQKYYHYSDFNSHVTNESATTKKFILTYLYEIKTLPTMEIASGTVDISGWDDVNGNISLHRAGPGKNQNEIEITTPIVSKKFNSTDKIPSGDIIMDFSCDQCGFKMNLSEDRAYYAPTGSLDIEVDERVKVLGSIVEEVGNEGVSEVEVLIKSTCSEMGNNFTARTVTDNNGNYEFADVPYGIYEVSYKSIKKRVTINNRNEKEINVDKIEVGGTFDIELIYKSAPEFKTEVKAIWENVNIDLDTSRNFGGLYLYADGTMQMFNNFDMDKNGFVEPSEGREIPFALMDGNSNNQVSYEEFTQYIDDQGEAGMLISIEPDTYEVSSDHEYYKAKYSPDDDFEVGLRILGVKTTDLDGYVMNDKITYEPNTVGVSWDIGYDLLNHNNQIVVTEEVSAEVLPVGLKSNGLVFKSSIPLSDFKNLIKNGQSIFVYEKVENVISKGALCEYELTIKPHE